MEGHTDKEEGEHLDVIAPLRMPSRPQTGPASLSNGRQSDDHAFRKMSFAPKLAGGRRASRRCSRRMSHQHWKPPEIKTLCPEKLKADIYREWVGRRHAFDMGKIAKGKGKGVNFVKQNERMDTEDNTVVHKPGLLRESGGLIKNVLKIEQLQKEGMTEIKMSQLAPIKTPSQTSLRVNSGNKLEPPGGPPARQRRMSTIGPEIGSAQYRRLSGAERRDFVKNLRKSSKKNHNMKDMGLTKQQIKAFHEVFDLFDRNGGGTIDADELDETLRSVDIVLSKDEINDVLLSIDKDGSGEIDFSEFLQLMTSTERFLETLTGRSIVKDKDSAEKGTQEVLIFEALTEFMRKSALKSMDEIVGYYNTKYTKFQVPHVVNHYAAGARLIGLTEKQLKEHFDAIKATNAGTDSLKSPYAQPLHIMTSSTNIRQKMLKGQQRTRKRGRIKLRIRTLQTTDDGEDRLKEHHPQLIDSKYKQRTIARDMGRPRGIGWIGHRTEHIDVKLPPYQLGRLLPFDTLTAEDLPLIRQHVTAATQEYLYYRRRQQMEDNIMHWQMLDTDLITPDNLQHRFRSTFGYYTELNPEFLAQIL